MSMQNAPRRSIRKAQTLRITVNQLLWVFGWVIDGEGLTWPFTLSQISIYFNVFFFHKEFIYIDLLQNCCRYSIQEKPLMKILFPTPSLHTPHTPKQISIVNSEIINNGYVKDTDKPFWKIQYKIHLDYIGVPYFIGNSFLF